MDGSATSADPPTLSTGPTTKKKRIRKED